ncbi:hypothetical protein [Alkalihalophilus marmarensis]|uniref:hypothetical protein n=1 Tax=Alkalihalophilus marmarensis TaxID=521377 RepID=UPI002E20F005|nr:hypothetical protein [Alkalihalophilus marmarensis]
MNNPVKIMLLGITVILLSLFIQLSYGQGYGPSNTVQLLFAAGFITVITGFFMKKKE